MNDDKRQRNIIVYWRHVSSRWNARYDRCERAIIKPPIYYIALVTVMIQTTTNQKRKIPISNTMIKFAGITHSYSHKPHWVSQYPMWLNFDYRKTYTKIEAQTKSISKMTSKEWVENGSESFVIFSTIPLALIFNLGDRHDQNIYGQRHEFRNSQRTRFYLASNGNIYFECWIRFIYEPKYYQNPWNLHKLHLFKCHV